MFDNKTLVGVKSNVNATIMKIMRKKFLFNLLLIDEHQKNVSNFTNAPKLEEIFH